MPRYMLRHASAPVRKVSCQTLLELLNALGCLSECDQGMTVEKGPLRQQQCKLVLRPKGHNGFCTLLGNIPLAAQLMEHAGAHEHDGSTQGPGGLLGQRLSDGLARLIQIAQVPQEERVPAEAGRTTAICQVCASCD